MPAQPLIGPVRCCAVQDGRHASIAGLVELIWRSSALIPDIQTPMPSGGHPISASDPFDGGSPELPVMVRVLVER